MTFLDTLGDRTRPAFDAILKLLDDGHWHPHQELVDTATSASDLTPKTIDKLIRSGWRARHYQRSLTGRAQRVDQAKYRLKAGAR